MKLVYFTAVVAALFGFAAAEEVLVLTSSTFQDTIDKNPFVLVEFYAPWCGHCKKLAPEYEKAAAKTNALDPKVILANVDATVEKDLASKFGVSGFPTLKWFVNGKVSDYTGGRTEDTIVSWVQKKTGPPAIVLKTVEDFDKFKDSADAVALGFFKDEAEASSYIDHARGDDETPYAVCYENCAEILAKSGVDASKKVAVLQKFDAGKAEFDGDITDKDAIATFISSNIIPLIVPFSQKTASKIFSGPIKQQVILFIDSEDSDDSKKLVEDVKPVAEKFKGKLLFVTVQKSDARVLDFFGIKEAELPAVRIVNMGPAGTKKYKLTDAVTPGNIEKLAEEYFAGNLKLDLKSEEIVPESEQGPVRVIVGKDFEDVVTAAGKDVFVEFYAPWCGHCKKLEPEYVAVGEHFKGNENVVIAKMDSTANEAERVQVTGFPTLKFFPADSDEIVDYTGERTKDGIIKFLEENAKNLK